MPSTSIDYVIPFDTAWAVMETAFEQHDIGSNHTTYQNVVSFLSRYCDVPAQEFYDYLARVLRRGLISRRAVNARWGKP
jgi:hypothetical protein